MRIIKKIIVTLLMCLCILGMAIGFNIEICADSYNISTTGMSEKASRLVGASLAARNSRTDESIANSLIANYALYPEDTTVAVNALLKGGVFVEYTDIFKDAGIPIDGNNTSPSSSNQSSVTQKKNKTEFTVEDVESYTAWVTKNCNIRSGADITYDKVGSLKKFEEVKVTGKASTGWYRITTSSGAEAYISNSLITTDDPKKVTVQTVEKNGEVVTTTVEGENPSAVAQVVEEIKAEEVSDEEPKEEEPTYTSEITKEATCSEKGIITYTSEKGDSYTEEIPMLEHEPGDWEVSKEPNLIKAGEKVKKCSVCGEILETQKIPAKTNMLIGMIIGCVVAIGGGITGFVLSKKKH